MTMGRIEAHSHDCRCKGCVLARAEERHTDLREVTDEIKRDLKADVYQLHKKLDSGKVYVFRRGSPEDERDT